MPEHMSGRRPEYMSNKMPHGRPHRMPDGISEYMPDDMSAGGDHSKKIVILHMDFGKVHSRVPIRMLTFTQD